MPTHSVATLAKQLDDVGRAVHKAFAAFSRSLAPALAELSAVSAAFAEALRQLPADTRVVVTALASRGWYLSGEMGVSQLRPLLTAVEANDNMTLDTLMGSWVSASLDEIEGRATARFPAHASIVAAALRAHRRGEFELSVPVLLVQVEGMFVREFGKKLYSTRDGIPRTAGLASTMADSPLAEAFLAPLSQQTGLTASQASRQKFPAALNRHEVLHGISTDYATESNSLKAISLLDYFVTLIAKDSPAPRGGA